VMQVRHSLLNGMAQLSDVEDHFRGFNSASALALFGGSAAGRDGLGNFSFERRKAAQLSFLRVVTSGAKYSP